MIVAYAADINLYDYLQPATSALIKHNPEVKEIHIFLKEQRDMKKYGLEDERIIFHPFKETLSFISSLGPYQNYRFGLMTFTRLALPIILEDKEKVLYLDVDAFVRGNLKDFYNTDLTDYAVAGVFEPKKSINRIYLNAGVLLLNLNYLRTSGIWNKWLDMANNQPALRDGDQDIINNTCQEKIITVSATYNSNIYTYDMPDPIIAHGTPIKPWDIKSPFFKEFMQYKK